MIRLEFLGRERAPPRRQTQGKYNNWFGWLIVLDTEALYFFTSCWLPWPQNLEFFRYRTHKAIRLNPLSITGLGSALNWRASLDCVWSSKPSISSVQIQDEKFTWLIRFPEVLSWKAHSIFHGGEAPIYLKMKGYHWHPNTLESGSWKQSIKDNLVSTAFPDSTNPVWFHSIPFFVHTLQR